MSTSTAKSDYLLLFRGNVWDRGLSPAQLQKVVSDWMAWFERLKEEGKCLGGHPLEEEGKVVSGKQGRTIADGPFRGIEGSDWRLFLSYGRGRKRSDRDRQTMSGS